MSIKSIKEKQLLVNLSKTFGQDIDPSIVKEVNRQREFEQNIKQSARSNWIKDLQEALQQVKTEVQTKKNPPDFPMPPSLDELEEFLSQTTEEVNDLDSLQEPENASEQIKTKTESLAERAARTIKLNENSYQQPDPSIVPPDINSIQRKIKYLEQWIGKISLYGPGGGAGSEAKLDKETKLVNTPTYDITTKDFYVGVNYTGSVSISLPTIVKNGTMYIIKDESGNCSNNPITVSGNVDNDPGGFILQQDNGGIQMIYRNGWRII